MSAWMRLWAGSTQRWRPDRTLGASDAPGWRRSVSLDTGKSLRILFLNQYYWPDHASTAQHLTDLAESLARKGHEVHVVCGRGGYRPGQTPWPKDEVHNGVHIHRVGATSLGRRSTWRRMTDYLTFYAFAALRSFSLPRFDVVTTLTTPPLIALIGTTLRRWKGSRHVFWSMDLHPDASIALGRMKPGSPVVRFLSRLSDMTYRQADRVVVLGAYMADRIRAKGARVSRLETIPVWSRADEIEPLPRAGHPLRERFGLADRFVVMYSGNLGLAHSFAELLGAARRLCDRSDIVFLFVGDGPRLKEVRAAKDAEGLDNLLLMDYFPRECLRESLSIADVHLITMRAEMTGIVVPGKLYGAMASGRPTVFVGPAHCESADTIRQAECGLTFRLGDVASLVDAITYLAADPELCAEMGRRGRAAFLAQHEREACCAQWAALMSEMATGAVKATTVDLPPAPSPREPIAPGSSQRQPSGPVNVPRS